jgi:hypothetical protein
MHREVERWIETLHTNQWIIGKQTEGLSHADTLLSLPFRGNCMNWVLGHIVEHRDWMLRAVDLPTHMAAEEALLYRRGSDPITVENAVGLDRLMAYLSLTKGQITDILDGASADFLKEVPEGRILLESHKGKNRLDRLQGLLWHEAYHVGQLEILRQLTGVNDRIL